MLSISVSFAMDRDGCLTCHQYPGLVAFEDPDTFRVLHINEEKYLKSGHGALDCVECHTEIVKIPHEGNTKVSCSVKCHHSEKTMAAYDTETDCTVCHSDSKAGIKHMEKYLDTFHDPEQLYILSLRDESSCRVCHLLYPHNKNRLVSALINMHSGFITCEVCHSGSSAGAGYEVCGNCHISREKLTYAWKAPENVLFSGEPYGTYYKNPRHRTSILERSKNYISGTIRLITDPFSADNGSRENTWTEYSLSRIALFSEEDGKKSIVMNTADTEAARRFKAVEKMLSPEARKTRVRFFHRNVVKQEIITVCGDCHSQESILDYESLGFDEIKAERLKELNIRGLVTKYSTFYFPKFLDRE